MDGIISSLTRKHGGDVHDKGIITITSKSMIQNPEWALTIVVDLGVQSEFLDC
jgi:hypothetical protein